MWTELTPNGKYKARERYVDPLTGKTKIITTTIDKDTKAARKAAEEILRDGLDELKKDLLFHEYYADIQRLKEEQRAELLKFVYGYRKTSTAEELRSFLQVLRRMQTENKI